MGKETKTEIRGSDGNKFEEESMWQGKPVSEWTPLEGVRFFELLMNDKYVLSSEGWAGSFELHQALLFAESLKEEPCEKR